MRRLPRVLVAMALLLLLGGGMAVADHIDLPIKWSQLPDMDTGLDVYSVHVGTAVCSNDWLCTSPDPIVAVRWWGSYLDDTFETIRDPNYSTRFELVFHYDVPANTQDPETGEILAFSHPTGPPLHYVHLTPQEHHYGDITVTDLSGQVTIIERVYEYNAYLDEPFDQWYWRNYEGGGAYPYPAPGNGIFWLDIGYVDPVDPSQAQWGWHEALNLQLDKAISNPGWHFGPWVNVTVLNRDLAFELMTVPEPFSMAFLGSALVGVVCYRVRKRRKEAK